MADPKQRTTQEYTRIVRALYDELAAHDCDQLEAELLLSCALFELVAQRVLKLGHPKEKITEWIMGMLNAFLEENWEGLTTGKHSEIH